MKDSCEEDSFFPVKSSTTGTDNSSLDSSLIDMDISCSQPFINEGEEYQAEIPEFRELNSEDLSEVLIKEDLLWSDKILNEVEKAKFDSYLKLITKNSLVFGESNNLELGLHVLNYYDGDFEKSVKTFLNDSISLPEDSPILNYSYSGKFKKILLKMILLIVKIYIYFSEIFISYLICYDSHT